MVGTLEVTRGVLGACEMVAAGRHTLHAPCSLLAQLVLPAAGPLELGGAPMGASRVRGGWVHEGAHACGVHEGAHAWSPA